MALFNTDDLQLKTFSVAPTLVQQGSSTKTSSTNECSNAQDQHLKKLSAVQHELEKTQEQLREEREAFAGPTMGGDKVAKKIVELSKKNRELAAEVARHKSRTKELQETVNKLELKTQQYGSGASVTTSLPVTVAEQCIPSDGQEAKVHQLEEEVSSLKSKLASLRNQCQSLKQEVTVTQKVLSREVGEGFSVSELLGGVPGWRGRAQQITNLQNKVSELKRQVKVFEGQRGGGGGGDVEIGGGDKERGRIRQLEQKRRTELELKASELAELKERHAEVVRQLAASKARNQTLSSQLKNAAKSQPSSTASSSSSSLHTSSGGPSTRLASAGSGGLSARLTSAGGERGGGSRGCPQCARTKAMCEREVARKEKAIEDLKQQLRVVKESERRMTSEVRVQSAPGLSLPIDSGTRLSSQPNTPVGGVEWATRAKVAETEKDKLLEMVTLLHQRLDEAVRRIAGQQSSKSSAQKGGGEAEVGKNISKSELMERLQIQTDESRALKETLSSYQTAKAQDIRILTELLKQSRVSFAQTIEEIAARTQNRQ